MDGLDKQIVSTMQRVLHHAISFVEMLLRAGEFVRNTEVINKQLVILEALRGNL